MRKVCVVTGTRAEYGLMRWLIEAIDTDDQLELQLVVTGMHLSPEFGLTYKTIENDGYKINKKVELLISSDTPVGVSKSMGLGMISFAEVFEDLAPDLILVLGDRFEIFSAVSAAMISRIPVGHIHGGEATEGLIDEPIRHSITKMSHLHFTTGDEYKKRVIQLGEQPARVFNTGAPGLDNIAKLSLLDRDAFSNSIDFDIGNNFALVTFHPVTLEQSTAETQFAELLKALEHFENLKVIFTMPNADTDGRIIMDLIKAFVEKHPEMSRAFTSLGQLRYLSALSHASVVIGNSSSGLIEAPSFKVPTINIGDRQKGRIKAASVLDTPPNANDIITTLEKALSSEYKATLANLINPYGGPGASERIKDIIKTFDLSDILKKAFHDL